jgi:hypothetical protein
MNRKTVDTYRVGDTGRYSNWAREPGGRLLIPGEDGRVKLLDFALGTAILLAAIVALCVTW